MKIQPIAQGSAVPTQVDNSVTQTDPGKIARAKMIASGQIVPKEQKQETKAEPQNNLKTIKMNTQRSTNRHETIEIPQENKIEEDQNAVSDTNEAQKTEEIRKIDPQLAAVAKAKRALQIERAELAKQKAEFEANKSQGTINPSEYVSIAELKANPLKVFEAGVTYDQLTEAILANQNGQTLDPTVIDQLVEKKLNERLEKEFGSRDSQAEQQVLTALRRDVDTLVQGNDDYELVRGEAAQNEVVELIHRTYKKGWPEQNLPAGSLLDIDTAAKFVEDYLLEESMNRFQYKKIKSKLTPAQEAQEASQKAAPQKPGTVTMRTLTNRVSNTAAPLDRRSRAIAAFQGTLRR
jgi:hypothetical protein